MGEDGDLMTNKDIIQSRLIDSDNQQDLMISEEALKALEDKIDVLVEMKIQDVLYKMLSAID